MKIWRKLSNKIYLWTEIGQEQLPAQGFIIKPWKQKDSGQLLQGEGQPVCGELWSVVCRRAQDSFAGGMGESGGFPSANR